jgi:hypothetical protein
LEWVLLLFLFSFQFKLYSTKGELLEESSFSVTELKYQGTRNKRYEKADSMPRDRERKRKEKGERVKPSEWG